MIKDGKIVPSEVTIKLLQKAIQENGNDKFLIDGFPRNEENRAAFESVGRVDDNIETIRKRFNVFLEYSLPVIRYYESKGKVRKVVEVPVPCFVWAPR
ncbi:UMP-CMP kinase [Euphorbia peplus]|nr:UMP-CMP kinase [Euphorbia peplus]